MLSQELRPSNFEEMAGQEENIKIMKAIIRNPEKAPKCLVFAGAFGCGKTTTSRILARALNGITDKDYDLLSSPFYYEYDSTVIGNIDTIRSMRDQFTVSYGDYYRIIVFDECLHYNSPVTLSDGTSRMIGDIVTNKLPVEVRSYNTKTGRVENKKVTGWFINSPKKFYKVKFSKQKGYVICSDNHRFITDLGEIHLRDLKVGDKVLRDEPSLSDEQLGFMIGTLLGDSSIRGVDNIQRSCPRVTFTQGYDQRDWLNLKVKVFENVMSNEEIKFDFSEDFKRYHDGFDNRKPVARINTRSLLCMRFLQELMLDRGKKVVKREALNKLTPAGIAAWFMDDGQRYCRKWSNELHDSRVHLHTSGFSEEENDIIIQYFKEVWGISFSKSKPGDYIFLSTSTVEDTKKFYNLIAPEMVEGVLDYKLPKEYIRGDGILNITKGRDVSVDYITSIEEYCDVADSYDIEVEDNHNYFAGGILVHNCHSISTAAQNALLKVLEEAIGRVFFVMCTTEPNKLLPTIRSRSLELEFKPVSVEAVESNIAKLCIQRQIQITPKVVRLIADRSAGHMRNAHMLLDKYLLLGEEDFVDSVKSSISLYCDFLKSIYLRDKEACLTALNSLMNMPRDDLHTDWNTVMTEAMKSLAGFPISNKEIQEVIDLYGRKDFNLIIQVFFNNIMKSAFVDMAYFQATFCYIYTSLSQALEQRYPNGAPNKLQVKSSEVQNQQAIPEEQKPQQQAPTLADKRVMIRR